MGKAGKTVRTRIPSIGVTAAGIAASFSVHAHVGAVAGETGFAAGFLHPCSGFDHLLAMVAVGIWAAQLGGRAVWAVPLAFVVAMAGGAGLGLGGVPMILPEAGIAVSVLVLGLLVALMVRLRLGYGLALVGAFGVFHGYTHGVEMPAATSLPLYAGGFLLSTGLLHGCGLLAGAGLRNSAVLLRVCGAVVALAGILLVAANG